MSLDVYLNDSATQEHECICPTCDNKHKHWRQAQFYTGNITHNLANMAGRAGLYNALWQPGKIGITHAHQLIEPLKLGLVELECDEARFRPHDASNGWGRYEHLVAFVREYLAACEAHPQAEVSVWR